MEERFNLNLKASNYIPRNQRYTQGNEDKVIDTKANEVSYENQGNKSHNLSGAANYYSYNNNYKKQEYDNDYRYNDERGANKTNYNNQSQSKETYNNYDKPSNQAQSYSENYYDGTKNNNYDQTSDQAQSYSAYYYDNTKSNNHDKNSARPESHSGNYYDNSTKSNNYDKSSNQPQSHSANYYDNSKNKNYDKSSNQPQSHSENYYDNPKNKIYEKYSNQAQSYAGNYYDNSRNKTSDKNSNQPQSYSENYYDNSKNSSYYDEGRETRESSNNYYNKNNNYSNPKNYDNNYQHKTNYGNKNTYKNTGGYKDYNQSYQYDGAENRNFNNSNKEQFRIVEKDISKVKKITSQDLEDDYLDEGAYTADASEMKGDFEKDYDLDDYFEGGELDNYNQDDDEYDDKTTNKFGEMNLNSQDSYGKNSKENPTQEPFDFNDKSSKKHLLVFSNKDSFTEYVEEMIKKERNNFSQISDNIVNILMIAEKPSIAKTLSEALGGKVRSVNMGRGKGIYVFDGYFGNVKAKFTVSSVMGHVYTSDFQSAHNNWNAIDYLDLYDVPVAKLEANKKTRIPFLLNKLAKGKDILCLWLDCDKEGENICYEVIYNVYPFMNKKHYQQIYRAKFSSLTKPDLKAAFNKMKDPPNKNESVSVDARQVIDLKIGVSFTRFLTSAVLPGIKNIGTTLLSYGPCQTPTLWFCVNRQNEIDKFISREYFKVYAEIEHLKMKHKIPYRMKFFEKFALSEFMKKMKDANTTRVVNVLSNKHKKEPPAGINTVQLLRTSSSFLKMSPHETMVIAEKLYTMGYVTYPRTETTKYAASFDFTKALAEFADHSTFGKSVSNMLKTFKKPILRGEDVGDHPPITPSRVASQKDLSGDYWRLYELICQSFFASLAEPAEYEEKVYQLDINGEIFEAESSHITKEGYLAFMEWKRNNYVRDFPILKLDSVLTVQNISTESNWTDPPSYLSESDLLKLMEHNKIGTDASMPVHIENISQRGYVKVDANRRLIPTKLGKALIESISSVEPDLVQPTIRSQIETYVDQVAKGTKMSQEALTFTIELYKKKFLIVRQNYEKILSGFKKYFDIDLMEMGKVYQTIKSKNEALRIQNTVKKSISQIDTDLNTCSTCNNGKIYVEYDEFDKYLLLCSNCKLRKRIIPDAIKIKVIKNLKCQACHSFYVEVKVENPFLSGETEYTGCLFCDPNLK